MRPAVLIIILCFVLCHSKAQDKQILQANRSLTYLVQYSDSLSKITLTDTLVFQTTALPWRWDPDKQITVLWKYSQKKLPEALKKTMYTVGDNAVDSTGAIENENEFWLHPPRAWYFSITEIAPFPRAMRYAKVHDVYYSTLNIGSGWGLYENTQIQNTYKVTGRDTLTILNRTYPCIVIDATGSFQQGENKVRYLFNKNLGFVHFDYRFYNGVKLQMRLLHYE